MAYGPRETAAKNGICRYFPIILDNGGRVGEIYSEARLTESRDLA